MGRPVCCTLQGEDLFLSQLPEPYRRQSWELIRANAAHVDRYAAVSEFAADYWRRELGIPAHRMNVVPLGINLEGYDPGLRVHSDRFTVGYLARVAPRRVCIFWLRATFACGARPTSAARVLESAGVPGARASRIPARHRKTDEGCRLRRRVSISGRTGPGS